MPPNGSVTTPGTPGTPAGSLNPEPESRPPRRCISPCRTRGRAGRSPGGATPGARTPAGRECGVGSVRETQRRNAAEGSERAVRVALSSSRRVVEAARARSVRSGGGDIRGKRNGWRLRASRAREELHAPAAGRSPNPGSSRSTRRRRATGERAFRLGRARLEVPVMKRDEIGSPPFFIAQAERHAADRHSSYAVALARVLRSGFSESARSD